MGSSFSTEACSQVMCPDWRFVSCFLVHMPVMLSHILGMHKSNEGCKSLLENTTNVLDEGALQMLLVSAQKTNIGLCIKYAAQ